MTDTVGKEPKATPEAARKRMRTVLLFALGFLAGLLTSHLFGTGYFVSNLIGRLFGA